MSFLITALHCPLCKDKKSVATGSLVEEKNASFFEMKCTYGHTFYSIPTFPDYGYFMMNGLSTFNSGHYFESFSSIYYAYERFKLTFSEAILLKRNRLNTYEQVLEEINPIKNNSVQINGAFSALYAIQFNEKAKDISKKDIEKRNNIIHGVQSPQKETVKKIFIDIIDFIHAVEWKLSPTLPIDSGFYVENPILDLVFKKSEYTRSYLQKNKKINNDDIIQDIAPNFSVGNKNILPIGNQTPVDPDSFSFTFEEMANALQSFQSGAELLMKNSQDL